ncbi:hypothetical protein ACL03H_10800 [Saccharopolyspora sp. MS10]|uniref:hypothetical protein n=1 Tax=Saccharopolyspora sp. MS10 TaxID=3385973 RepID=UPI00399F6780
MGRGDVPGAPVRWAEVRRGAGSAVPFFAAPLDLVPVAFPVAAADPDPAAVARLPRADFDEV